MELNNIIKKNISGKLFISTLCFKPSRLKDDLQEFINNIQDDPEVGAVIVDFDINTTRLHLQKALTYLKRKDCLFIAAACDRELPMGSNVGSVIGKLSL